MNDTWYLPKNTLVATEPDSEISMVAANYN